MLLWMAGEIKHYVGTFRHFYQGPGTFGGSNSWWDVPVEKISGSWSSNYAFPHADALAFGGNAFSSSWCFWWRCNSRAIYPDFKEHVSLLLSPTRHSDCGWTGSFTKWHLMGYIQIASYITGPLDMGAFQRREEEKYSSIHQSLGQRGKGAGTERRTGAGGWGAAKDI